MAPATAGGRGAGSRAVTKPAGQGFAAATALSRGMGDLSMTGGLDDLMATQHYEFKENNEIQDVQDDIDDFERRLAGGAPKQHPAKPPLAAKPAVRSAKPKPAMPVTGSRCMPGKKMGTEYVRSAQKAKGPGANVEDEDDTDISVQQAMSDLDKFEQQYAVNSDED